MIIFLLVCWDYYTTSFDKQQDIPALPKDIPALYSAVRRTPFVSAGFPGGAGVFRSEQRERRKTFRSILAKMPPAF